MDNNVVINSKGNVEFPININQIQDLVEQRVYELEDFDERALRLNQFVEFGKGILSISIGLLEKTRKEQVEKLIKTHQKERERLLETNQGKRDSRLKRSQR